MKVDIDIITESVSFSCTINGIEWVDLINFEEDKYNPELVGLVSEKLLIDIQKQYNLPSFVMDYLWDGEDYWGDNDVLPCTQDTFVKLVENNKNTKIEVLGHHDSEKNNTVYRYKLTLEI